MLYLDNVEITIDEPSEEVVVRETSEAVAVSAPATASDGLVGKIIQAIGIGSKFVASGVVTTGNLVRSGLERCVQSKTVYYCQIIDKDL